MAQEQVLEDEVVARPYPGQGGREYEPEQCKHRLSIADPCSREVLPSHNPFAGVLVRDVRELPEQRTLNSSGTALTCKLGRGLGFVHPRTNRGTAVWNLARSSSRKIASRNCWCDYLRATAINRWLNCSFRQSKIRGRCC